ncbi:hypothetical protein L2E82_29690 [Cichorium intybus]|uniref:Uncharacterized protein n=1 Tax=Cichorium intybus TaxID=13427 RepID=A0ACB9CYX8_CICIN|nr:hypothetical protein L2E82_29690 [Cichorium intybus]
MDDAMESEDDPPSIEGTKVDHPMTHASLISPLSKQSPNVTGLLSHSLDDEDVFVVQAVFKNLVQAFFKNFSSSIPTVMAIHNTETRKIWFKHSSRFLVQTFFKSILQEF